MKYLQSSIIILWDWNTSWLDIQTVWSIILWDHDSEQLWCQVMIHVMISHNIQWNRIIHVLTRNLASNSCSFSLHYIYSECNRLLNWNPIDNKFRHHSTITIILNPVDTSMIALLSFGFLNYPLPGMRIPITSLFCVDVLFTLRINSTHAFHSMSIGFLFRTYSEPKQKLRY